MEICTQTLNQLLERNQKPFHTNNGLKVIKIMAYHFHVIKQM
jgi:hypothetical protein